MNKDFYKVKVRISGTAPLRYNRFIEIDKNSVGKSKMTDEQQKEDAMQRAYFDEDKGFYIPSNALRACILNGAKKVKIGRGTASKPLSAIMLFDEIKNYLDTKEYAIQKDVVRIPPRTGARITQMWVVIEDWSVEFVIELLEPTFPLDGLKQAIDIAGRYEGLLDGRPQLGRFTLDEFGRI